MGFGSGQSLIETATDDNITSLRANGVTYVFVGQASSKLLRK